MTTAGSYQRQCLGPPSQAACVTVSVEQGLVGSDRFALGTKEWGTLSTARSINLSAGLANRRAAYVLARSSMNTMKTVAVIVSFCGNPSPREDESP